MCRGTPARRRFAARIAGARILGPGYWGPDTGARILGPGNRGPVPVGTQALRCGMSRRGNRNGRVDQTFSVSRQTRRFVWPDLPAVSKARPGVGARVARAGCSLQRRQRPGESRENSRSPVGCELHGIRRLPARRAVEAFNVAVFPTARRTAIAAAFSGPIGSHILSREPACVASRRYSCVAGRD